MLRVNSPLGEGPNSGQGRGQDRSQNFRLFPKFGRSAGVDTSVVQIAADAKRDGAFRYGVGALGPNAASSAVAETSKTFGAPGQRSLLLSSITRTAGPQAAQDIADAAVAGRPAGRGRTREGLGEAMAAVESVKGLPRVLASPMAATLEDPSFVRGLAGRALTRQTIPPLPQQNAMRAGQGALAQPPAVTRMTSWFVRAVPQIAAQAPGALAGRSWVILRAALPPQ